MIGKIFPSFFPYKDKGEVKHKSRPVLIIAVPTHPDTEYTVLPVASISRREFLNFEFDVNLKVGDHPKISITRDSYIRTHKQTVIYKTKIDFQKCMGNLKIDYPEKFDEVLEKLCEFETKIIEYAKKA